ncbi:MAG: glucose-1-phosphate adenylyltransferase subunit GlgD [Clostridiales bacterium GWF2_38_85]|nr:MAG: glucose-1-phosphate adenylyltransferase subunit GlgD [Clostridiales bacterium GWF2_38_85]
MSTAGIIFSNIHDENISELTRMRTMASVPFGCRYRFIDFALSNMVNSEIYNVGVITHYNYQSLMDHIGTGKDWDLSRRSGGIKILPPFITAYAGEHKLYTTRLEALKGIYTYLQSLTDDYVVLCDCDVVCNIDLRDIIEYHIEIKSNLTIAVKQVYIVKNTMDDTEIIESDENGRITDILTAPFFESGYKDINLNICVFTRSYLLKVISDSIVHNHSHLSFDILQKNIKKERYRVYKYKGYFARISSIKDYFRHSMDLLNSEVRTELFRVKNRPIYTKVRNSPPAQYTQTAKVSNSLIADGCIIEGIVENSILFRGVKVNKNAYIKNSILMQDTLCGDNVDLNCIITDKNVVIRDGRILSGHETLPFVIGKNGIV